MPGMKAKDPSRFFTVSLNSSQHPSISKEDRKLATEKRVQPQSQKSLWKRASWLDSVVAVLLPIVHNQTVLIRPGNLIPLHELFPCMPHTEDWFCPPSLPSSLTAKGKCLKLKSLFYFVSYPFRICFKQIGLYQRLLQLRICMLLFR